MANNGSAFIPDGLLPPKKGNEREYMRLYQKLRKQYDPHYLDQIREKNRKCRMKRKEAKR